MTAAITLTFEPTYQQFDADFDSDAAALASFSVTFQSVVQGAQGDSPVFSVATTTTGEAGTSASVAVNNTDPLAPALSFTIPRGDQGTPGSGFVQLPDRVLPAAYTNLLIGTNGKVIISEPVDDPVAAPASGLTVLPSRATPSRYANVLIGTNGKVVVGEPSSVIKPDSLNAYTEIFAEGVEYGSLVVTDDAVDNSSSVTDYPGPALESALWISSPEIVVSSEFRAKVSFDRTETPFDTGETLDFTFADGCALDPAVMANYQFNAQFYGQSLAGPIGEDAEVVSPSAVVPGIALMPGLSGTLNQYSPYVARRSFMGTVIDLREDDGESPCSGFGKKFEELCLARGSNLYLMVATSAVGGTELFNLISNNPKFRPTDSERLYPYWSDFTRTMRQMRSLTLNVSNRTPVQMPLLLAGPGYTESSVPVTEAAEFIEWLVRTRDQFNAASAKEFGWSPAAPKMPILVTPPGRACSNTFTGTTLILDFDLGGPLLGCWRALKRVPGIIFPGPDYFLPAYTDDTHPSPAGMYYLGEMFARCMDAVLFGNGWTPVVPYSFTRNSATEFEIDFSLMSGNIEIDDGSIITDFDTGVTTQVRKGILIWDLETGAIVPTTSVTATGLDRKVTFEIEAGHDGDALVIDYGMWRDLVTGDNFGREKGARGHIRSSTPHSTTLSGGETQYDWCMQFREKLPLGNGHQYIVKRAY